MTGKGVAMSSGWQQPPKHGGCLHLASLGAAIVAPTHEVGHEWRCVCGAKFVVRLREGRKVLTGPVT